MRIADYKTMCGLFRDGTVRLTNDNAFVNENMQVPRMDMACPIFTS